jgi:hypothetical protein
MVILKDPMENINKIMEIMGTPYLGNYGDTILNYWHCF